MIPYKSGWRAGYQKELDSLVRISRTDIDRLWRLQQQLTDGRVLGGVPPSGGIPVLEADEFEGRLETDCTIASPDGETGATTCTANPWLVVTPATPTTPAVLGLDTGTSIGLVNRDDTLAGATGKYVRWKRFTLSDGSWENRITWIGC